MISNTDSQDTIFSLFSMVARMMRNHIQNELPASYSFLQIKILSFVEETVNPSMKDVADELRVTSPAVTSIISKLVLNKDLERVNDRGDRRVIRLKLTSRGKATLRSSMKKIHEKVMQKISLLTSHEQMQFKRILKKLINHT